MKKYDIPNPSLFQKEIEVIRYSKAVPGHMNREFIPLFHYLGVPEVRRGMSGWIRMAPGFVMAKYERGD
jgi:hypothetical protein